MVDSLRYKFFLIGYRVKCDSETSLTKRYFTTQLLNCGGQISRRFTCHSDIELPPLRFETDPKLVGKSMATDDEDGFIDVMANDLTTEINSES